MIIVLHWWYIPILLAALGIICIWRAQPMGWFDGLFVFALGCALILAAGISLLTGWLA